MEGPLFGLIVLALVGATYFLPTIVAAARGKANTLAIFVLNLLLGWTFLGWVAALVWSLTQDAPARHHR